MFDTRNKDYGKKILDKINYLEIKSKIKYLGVIPLHDVYKLNANCFCLINPSFFEGWSTTVEEAKSFGTPTILSNISVHREQSPKSIFFNPNKFKDLSKILIDLTEKKYSLKRKNIKEVKEENEKRDLQMANQFLNVIQKTII